MYISKKGGKVASAQMELGDFLGKSRKIIFDLEDPKDAKKAQRTLKPKGIKPRRRRKIKVKPTKQQELKSILPEISFQPKVLPQSVKEQRKKEPISLNSIPNPVVNENQLKVASTPQTTKNTALVKATKMDIKENNSKAPSSPKSLPKSTFSPIFPSQLLQGVGDGGDLEVLCPNCKEALNFRDEDLDRSTLEHSRLCDCGFLVRISIRRANRAIFNDLKIEPKVFSQYVKITENETTDEYNNQILSYGIRAEPDA